jgi:hypothetical protein
MRGRIRQHAVDISKSIYRPLSTAQQIEEVLDEVLSKANQIHDPFEQSFFMMVHLPYLQPFADINKRTSRLARDLPCFVATSARSPSSMYQNRPTAAPPSVCTKWPASNCYATCTQWAYERSTQEYLAIKRDLAEPDPLRLAWRDLIKQTVRGVVTSIQLDPLSTIEQAVSENVPQQERSAVQALIVEELRRLHEGVLARYGLRPSEFIAWKAQHGR